MNILKHLSTTPKANARFSYYYTTLNNFRYNVPIAKLLKTNFSYSMGVFINYLAEENIELGIHPNGYILSIIDNESNPHKDVEFLYEVIHDNHYIIDSKKVEHDVYIKSNSEKIERVTFEAIVTCFKIINGLGDGYNSQFNNKFINSIKN